MDDYMEDQGAMGMDAQENGGYQAELSPEMFGGEEDHADAFIAPSGQLSQTFTAPVPVPEPAEDSPAVVWMRKNHETLVKKNIEEKAAKEQILSKSKDFLSKFYDVRKQTIKTRKDNNRDAEKVTQEAAVPLSGAPWEKVHALVNFSSGFHQKDVTKYKSTLVACKTQNVPVRV